MLLAFAREKRIAALAVAALAAIKKNNLLSSAIVINNNYKIKGIIVIGKITRLLIVWVIPLGVRLAFIPKKKKGR